MADINFPAIHKQFQEHMAKKGMSHLANRPAPQPQQTNPLHALVLHSMATMPNKDGDTPAHMSIRALADVIKRSVPDVSSIHKEKQQSY